MTISYLHTPLPKQLRDSEQGCTNQGEVRRAINEFLNTTSSISPGGEPCPRCGQTMQHLNATFALYGSDKQWAIRLPVCRCSLRRVPSEQLD
jgi:hypothetical protein